MKNTTERPARIRRRILAIGIPVATLLAGVGIGTSATGGVPEPRVETKIETREVEVPVEVEKIVEVEVAPTACLTALDNADDLNAVNADAFAVVADMFDAASSFDVAGINAGSAKLDKLQPEVAAAAAAYREEADACRAN